MTELESKFLRASKNGDLKIDERTEELLIIIKLKK